MSIKSATKRFLPSCLLSAYRRSKLNALRRRNASLPAREVFTRIYRNNEWGGRPGEFCSGTGSTETHAARYAEMVGRFIAENGVSRVVDLGCGDFVIGRKLAMNGLYYIGVDIVENLVVRNRELFAGSGVVFECLDITRDDLPDGDLCLVRQVLQHLSNAEIEAVLRRTRKYRYVIVTEHYPAPTVTVKPNLDRPHGGDTRIVDDSAVYLDLPPFNVHIARTLLEVGVDVGLVAPGEAIRSVLVENSE